MSKIDCTRLEFQTEENYFFRLSDYQQKLLDFYEANPTFIQPESARNEAIAYSSRSPDTTILVFRAPSPGRRSCSRCACVVSPVVA